MSMANAQATNLRNRINQLAAELGTCTTKAQVRCIKESIRAAETQLTEG